MIDLFHRVGLRSLAASALLLACVMPASAGQRKFAYTYEATTAPKGSFEFENWATWKRYREGGDKVNLFEFRHELEWGVTDRFQLGFYLADWSYNDSDPRKKASYGHSGVEAIYNLTNPNTSFLGSAVYLEALVGDDVFELEGKLLLQKNVGRMVFAYNAVLEAEWEGESLDERTGEFAQTLGISVEVNRNVSLGAEIVHEIELEEWRNGNESVVFAGPNASVRAGRFFATTACLFQLTDLDGEPDVQTRVIFGFDF